MRLISWSTQGRQVFFLMLAIIITGCKSEDVEGDFLKTCKNEVTSSRHFSGNRTKLKPIEVTPDHHKPQASYSILNNHDTSYILETSAQNQDYTIYDVTNAKIIKHGSLDYPPIQIGEATFKSFDSIYFQVERPATVFRFDSAGNVLEKIKIATDVDWQLEVESPGLFNSLVQSEFTFIDQDKVLMLLNPYGLWYYPNKDEIKTVAEYDLSKNELLSNFSQVAKELTMAPIELADKYTFPYLEYQNGNIYVSYPYNHSIYKYEENTKELVGKACVSSRFIERLAPPLILNQSSIQDNINFQISAAYYGGVYYHADLKVFSRVAIHAKDLYDKSGKLNGSNCDREYSLIIFDEELNVLDEIFLGNSDLWEWAQPTPSGYIVAGKCDEFLGEDYFKLNVKYDIREN